jgi:putative ABC transport system ATP-binding protein
LKLGTKEEGRVVMAATTETIIQIEDLTKIFYTDEIETHALSGVHLSISRGEYVAMSGPSGCGTSTLLSIIGDLTVAENVELPLTYRAGMPAAERKRRVQESLERVNMAHRMRHYPAQLSGGQQQRVAVARALAGSPSILLADEPTGNLDSKNGEAVMKLLQELHQEGATICMVTHDPRLVVLGIALNMTTLSAVEYARSDRRSCQGHTSLGSAGRTELKVVRTVVISTIKKIGDSERRWGQTRNCVRDRKTKGTHIEVGVVPAAPANGGGCDVEIVPGRRWKTAIASVKC